MQQSRTELSKKKQRPRQWNEVKNIMSSSKANHRVKQQESIRHEARRAHCCSLSGLRRTSLLFPQSVPVLTLYADLFYLLSCDPLNICRILLVRTSTSNNELCTTNFFLNIIPKKCRPLLMRQRCRCGSKVRWRNQGCLDRWRCDGVRHLLVQMFCTSIAYIFFRINNHVTVKRPLKLASISFCSHAAFTPFIWITFIQCQLRNKLIADLRGSM